MGIAGTLAALTRIQGVFLVLPLGWEALLAWREAGWRVGRPIFPLAGRLARPALAALGPLVGFAAFMVFSAAVAGQTPLDTQDAWGGRNFHPPWEVAQASWDWAVAHHDPLQALQPGHPGPVRRGERGRDPAGAGRLPLYAIPQIVLLATRIQPTPLTSTARYLLVVFPVFAILAQVRNRWLRLAWATGSIMFLALLLEMFLRGGYVA